MNNSWDRTESELIGPRVKGLLARIEEQIGDENFRHELKHSLKQLADVKFALDESSIVAVTDRKGKIIYVNNKFCDISKYSREELIGKDHRIITSGHHTKEFMSTLWETILSGNVWTGDIKNRAKDGSYYWVHTTIVPFLDAQGLPYQFLAIRNEVTRLKKVEEDLQHMMAQVMRIQEEERRKFSRELHDGIGQSLFSLLIQIDRISSAKDAGEENMVQLRNHIVGIMEEVRGLAWELRPSVLDDLGVVPAIRSYIDNYSDHYGIQVKLECSLRNRLHAQAETAVYRIIQEALTNIAKYADVSEAEVSITESDTEVVARIADRGAGFDTTSRSSGVGLFSMEERARVVGGRFELTSELERGTVITFTILKQL
ncbi:PAS domain-containing sensor histidine kinase [Paenibacillus mendelii]|uniref:histidine kinase n=1 Tax=Paenibacillus mendelii TaxID=206163 RepID=A0ABV6J5Y7_9BACL|nr:PAS domain-containing sensor histidine kinase [Paenibacillus mendelii]MCQ6560016.1 PAS domain-containing sensor histidine kinase [Paenibacillus mendelii]